jgi:hypothetical protein
MRGSFPADHEPVEYARGPRIAANAASCAAASPTMSLALPAIDAATAKGTCREARAGRRRPIDCGAMPFVIKRDGTWLYRGSPIGRKELVCLFASVLKREADGSYWLETPAERGRIEVEDAPFVAVELDWCGCGRQQTLTFRTNIDELVTAGPEHPIRVAHDVLTCEPTPYIKLRDGSGDACVEARIGRAVYYELVALAEPCLMGGQRRLGVWSSGRFFSLGDLPPGED